MKKLVSLLAIILCITILNSCREKTPAEKVEEAVKNAADHTEDAIDDATDAIDDAVK